MAQLTFNTVHEDEIASISLEFDIQYTNGDWTRGRDTFDTMYSCTLERILNTINDWKKPGYKIDYIMFTQWINPQDNPKCIVIPWLKAAGNILQFQNNEENKLKPGIFN